MKHTASGWSDDRFAAAAAASLWVLYLVFAGIATRCAENCPAIPVHASRNVKERCVNSLLALNRGHVFALEKGESPEGIG